jgi:hypothetical protein
MVSVPQERKPRASSSQTRGCCVNRHGSYADKSAGEATLPGVHINGSQARLVRGHHKLADDKEHNQQANADTPAPVNELEFNGIQRFVFHFLDFFVKLNFAFRFHELLRILY